MIEAVLLALLCAAVALLGVRTIRRSDARPAAEPTLLFATGAVLFLVLLSTGTTARLLFGPLGAGSFVVGCLLVLALAAVATTPELLPAPAPRTPFVRARTEGHLGRVVVGLAVVGVGAAALAAVVRLIREPDGAWDAFAFWTLRARLLLRAPGELGTIFSPEMAGSHPDYPLFVPGLVAAGGRLLGDASLLPSALVAGCFGALLVAAVVGAVAPRRGRAVAGVAVLLLVAMPHVTRQLAWRYADLPLATVLVLAVGWLASAHERPAGARAAVVFAGLLGSVAAWTKNEGIVHLLALCAALLVRPPGGLARAVALRRFAAGAAPLLVVLVAFKAGLAPENDLLERSSAATVGARLADPSRLGTIFAAWGEDLVKLSHWNLLLPLVLVGVLAGRGRGGGVVATGLVVVFVAGAYVLVYLLTPHDLAWHLRTSLERLVLHLVPSLLLLAALRWPRAEEARSP